MSQKNWTQHQRWQMSRLLGAVRWGQAWFKAPQLAPKLTAHRVADLCDIPRGMVHDFETQAQTNVEFAEQELKRPSSTLNQGTARVAGKPYHWTQTYDGVLRLAPGASPW